MENKTKKSLYELTLTEIEQFDLDQCTEYINLLAEKTKKWARLELALTTRREKIISEHTSDEEGGWFQEKKGKHFCRIWQRSKDYHNIPTYILVKISKFQEPMRDYSHRNNKDGNFVLLPLDGGNPILVSEAEVGHLIPYQISKDDDRIQKNHVKDCDTFYDKWEKTTPLVLVVQYGADHIELARDHFESITKALGNNACCSVVRYNDVWYIIGTINY